MIFFTSSFLFISVLNFLPLQFRKHSSSLPSIPFYSRSFLDFLHSFSFLCFSFISFPLVFFSLVSFPSTPVLFMTSLHIILLQLALLPTPPSYSRSCPYFPLCSLFVLCLHFLSFGFLFFGTVSFPFLSIHFSALFPPSPPIPSPSPSSHSLLFSYLSLFSGFASFYSFPFICFPFVTISLVSIPPPSFLFTLLLLSLDFLPLPFPGLLPLPTFHSLVFLFFSFVFLPLYYLHFSSFGFFSLVSFLSPFLLFILLLPYLYSPHSSFLPLPPSRSPYLHFHPLIIPFPYVSSLFFPSCSFLPPLLQHSCSTEPPLLYLICLLILTFPYFLSFALSRFPVSLLCPFVFSLFLFCFTSKSK